MFDGELFDPENITRKTGDRTVIRQFEHWQAVIEHYWRSVKGKFAFTKLPYDHQNEWMLFLSADVCAVDLALVADKTQSIGFHNFQLLRGFLLQISDSMDISPATTHEAVITFANTSTTLNRLDDIQFQSNEAMHVLIEGIDDKLGRPTRTDRALEEVVRLFTQGGSRPGFRNSMVILTDGKTNKASTPFNQIVSNLEVRVDPCIIGIGYWSALGRFLVGTPNDPFRGHGLYSRKRYMIKN